MGLRGVLDGKLVKVELVADLIELLGGRFEEADPGERIWFAGCPEGTGDGFVAGRRTPSS